MTVLSDAKNNDEVTLKRFAEGQVANDARVVTDGLASYNERSLNERPHDMIVQTKQERRENDTLQACHWAISLLKHTRAVRAKHLQANLGEFAFRYNRRETKGVGWVADLVFEQLVVREPLPMHKLVNDARLRRWFASIPGRDLS
jgi:hypothetical protein